MKNYKTLFFSILGILLTINISAQEFDDNQLKKIHNFLIDFGEAAEAKDTTKLKDFIFPLDYNRVNGRDFAIDKIIDQSQLTVGRDYEYSEKAFAIIRDSLAYKFEPMTDKVRKFFYHPKEVKIILDNYENNEFAVLDYKEVLMVLLIDEKQILLFFYEGMNRLLTE